MGKLWAIHGGSLSHRGVFVSLLANDLTMSLPSSLGGLPIGCPGVVRRLPTDSPRVDKSLLVCFP